MLIASHPHHVADTSVGLDCVEGEPWTFRAATARPHARSSCCDCSLSPRTPSGSTRCPAPCARMPSRVSSRPATRSPPPALSSSASIASASCSATLRSERARRRSRPSPSHSARCRSVNSSSRPARPKTRWRRSSTSSARRPRPCVQAAGPGPPLSRQASATSHSSRCRSGCRTRRASSAWTSPPPARRHRTRSRGFRRGVDRRRAAARQHRGRDRRVRGRRPGACGAARRRGALAP